MNTGGGNACPRCGFRYGWDGACCRHCHYPSAAPESPPTHPVAASPPPGERSGPPPFLSDPTEVALLRTILQDPEDEGARLVYADWLEERGDPRGEFLRSESALAGLPRHDSRFAPLLARCEVLAASVDRTWLVFIQQALRRSRILNCGASPSPAREIRFAFRCPSRWIDLTATEDEAVRFCAGCRQAVYYCETEGQAREHALAGHCIAIASQLASQVEEEAHSREEPCPDYVGLTVWSPPSLPLVNDRFEPYHSWGQALLRAPGGGQAPSAGRKRWWQFWK
jgi:uncharacterized protein (TIGR02996 family)